MNPQAAQNYLRMRVLTATPEQLQLMLYDGAIRFAEQARIGLEKRDYDQSYSMISRVQKIITELQCALKPDVSPEVCGKLSSLYNYVYRKLVDASIQHELPALDEAISILKYQRETWALLLGELGKSKAATAVGKLDVPAPDERMEASISMQG